MNPETTLVTLLVVFSTSIYFTFWQNKKIKTIIFGGTNSTKAQFTYYFFQKGLGLLVFGVIPLFIYLHFYPSSLYDLGFKLDFSFQKWLILMAICIIPFVINYWAANNEEHLKLYPQIRIKKWNTSTYFLDFLAWGAYLFGYELLFRGVLFFSLQSNYDIVWVFAINTILYSLAHLPKGKKETLAALPFGLIICWITLEYQSFIPAFLIHQAVAFSNDVFSVKYTKKRELKAL